MTVGTRQLPEPAADEALVAVEWAGLCGSDLHVLRTGAWVVEWPATLGHELYGRIVQAPPGSPLASEHPVVADSRVPCGRCDACMTDPNRCPNIQFVGEVFPGGFASHCVLPLSLLHAVPEAVPARSPSLPSRSRSPSTPWGTCTTTRADRDPRPRPDRSARPHRGPAPLASVVPGTATGR